MSGNQDYIDLVNKAWRELQAIKPSDTARLDEWKIKWALRGITRADRKAMVERRKKTAKRDLRPMGAAILRVSPGRQSGPGAARPGARRTA